MLKISQKIFIFFFTIIFTHKIFCENAINTQDKMQENNINTQENKKDNKPENKQNTQTKNSTQENTDKTFKLGLESITDKMAKNMGPVALITNQTGVNQTGERNIEVLLKNKIKLKKIFTPEHGLDGKIAAEKKVPDTIDEKTKIPVLSLYPGDGTKPLSAENLKNIDTIIFDMQDAGMRHYTYITTMFQAIDAASQFNKKIIILDRPNFLGPIMEGPLVEPNFKSAVSFAPVPLRHGMTVGELALYYNEYIIEKHANLEVIGMQNYKRDFAPETHNFLMYLSPNITSIQSCQGYSFLGLLGELDPINVGIGTDNAFQVILLSDNIRFSIKKWHNLQKILDSYGVKSEINRSFDKRKNNYYIGLKIKITNINTTKSFKLLIDVIKFFQDIIKNNKINKKNKSNLEIKFSNLFNKAVGTDKLRDYFDGKINFDTLKNGINKDLRDFYEKAKSCFLYKPFARPEYL